MVHTRFTFIKKGNNENAETLINTRLVDGFKAAWYKFARVLFRLKAKLGKALEISTEISISFRVMRFVKTIRARRCGTTLLAFRIINFDHQ